MARWLKQSTSVDVPIGPFLDDTDGKTAETTLTITQPDIRLKKNGGNWAQKNAAQTLTHEENGNYEVTLDTTDTDTLGLLRLHVAESGALPVFEDFIVLPANVYDALVLGSDFLQIDVAQFGNANGTFASGRPEVNTTHWGGTAVATAVVLAAANIASDAITAAKIAAGAFTSTKFASGAFDAVWSVTTRTLSSISALASEIRTAIGLASANLDTQIATLGTAAGQTTINNNVLVVAARLLSLAFTTGSVAADGGNTASTFKTNLSETSNEHWKESFVLITSGTLTGAVRKVDGYNGTTKFITVSPAFPSTPANSVTFTILNR